MSKRPKIRGIDVSVSAGVTAVCFFHIAEGDYIDREPHTHVQVKAASVLRAQRAQLAVMQARDAQVNAVKGGNE